MANYTIDFETYFDRREPEKYSLSSMSTEDYITDPRFEEILVSVKKDDRPCGWFSGTHGEMADWLRQFDWEENAATAQHGRFDFSILAVRFDIYPRHMYCTEYMANPTLKPRMKSLGLKALCEYFELPAKGEEVFYFEGMRREDFSSAELQRYATYCMNDTDQTRAVYKRLRGTLSNDEALILDMVLRMYTQPQLEFDIDAIEKGLRNAADRKAKVLSELEVRGVTKEVLSSGPKFAALLRSLGVEPPTKVSQAWVKKKAAGLVPDDEAPKLTYAFGKNDPEFLDLREEMKDDEYLTAIFDARTETKSTQEESRLKRFQKKAERHRVIRCPVVYASTHTQRLGGDEKENVLNLTNVGKYKEGGETKFKSYQRFSFAAPKGKKVVAVDYSQIEARIAAVTAGETKLVEAFRAGRDVYSEFATKRFGRQVSKALAEVDPDVDRMRKSGKETILGGDFGMGWRKYQRTVRGKGLILTDEEAEQDIAFFRAEYQMFPEAWNAFTQALNHLVHYREPQRVGDLKFLWDDETCAAIEILNGTRLYYPGLRAAKRKDSDGADLVFQRARDKYEQRIWGGVVMNNWCQSNAGVLIRRAMVDVWRATGFRPALQVYDEILWVIPDSDAEAFLKEASALMIRQWDLMPDLPLAVEGKIGQSYGHV